MISPFLLNLADLYLCKLT